MLPTSLTTTMLPGSGALLLGEGGKVSRGGQSLAGSTMGKAVRSSPRFFLPQGLTFHFTHVQEPFEAQEDVRTGRSWLKSYPFPRGQDRAFWRCWISEQDWSVPEGAARFSLGAESSNGRED